MVERNSDLLGTNAIFSISRASWLLCSSTQDRGPSIAIACVSAMPEFPPSFPDDEEASLRSGRDRLDKTAPHSRPADCPLSSRFARSERSENRSLPEGRQRRLCWR